MEKQDSYMAQLLIHLHQKNPSTGHYLEINIPNTIVYRNSIARSWYFTSEGQVKLKSKAKLDENYIKTYFLNKACHGIIGSWTSNLMLIEYFDEQKFADFFMTSELREGILQQFIFPKGNQNFTIQSVWTQQKCYYEKFVSKHDVHDQSANLYLRTLTYEKNQTLSQSLVSNLIKSKLNQLQQMIVDHIKAVNHNKVQVSKMELSFRIDSQDQIWLLNCTSLQFINELQTTKNKVTFPQYLDMLRVVLNDKCVKKEIICFRCEKTFHKDDIVKLKLRDIIESWSFDHLGKNLSPKDQNPLIMVDTKTKPLKRQTIFEQVNKLKQNSNGLTLPRDIEQNYLVPDLIRRIYPSMDEEAYFSLLENPGFLNSECLVCYECHVIIDKGVNVQHDISKLAQQAQLLGQTARGTGELRPELIKKRDQTTRREILNKVRSTLQTRADHTIQKNKLLHQCQVTGLYPVPTSFRFPKVSKSEFQSLLDFRTHNLSSRQNNTSTQLHSHKLSDRI